MTTTFPQQQAGTYYITEGGIETEIMYKWGFELPHFAMFPLLEKQNAADTISGMYRRYLDIVSQYGHNALIGGFDYRASPDWGRKLGYSASALEAANIGAIEFLRDIGREYQHDIPESKFVGYVGPRGDAYFGKNSMSVEEAEDYHSVQLTTLKKAAVDLVWAVTFNNPEEAIGVARAAKKIGLPLAISFSLDSHHRLNTGIELSEAIQQVDDATKHYPAFFSLNCSHPAEFTPALDNGDWTKRLRSIRPNAAKMDKIALCKLGHLEEGDPVELGELMSDISRQYPHMDIWGGCCGTCETHLEQIVRHLPSQR
ncbi:homocysteine S-methyltransferase family protein [Neptunicella sp. SCSIO 80796]|uniref:homocysteine S-methyltransferase family protein n=1 Tax=Neptunicella plasticusilytica TaxID=3117012 RepID=UPI003A4DB733